MYWLLFLGNERAIQSLPHSENECQLSVNNFYLCIMGHLCSDWVQTSIYEILAVIGRSPNCENLFSFGRETMPQQLHNWSHCTACWTSAMNRWTTGLTECNQFNYLNWFEPVFSTATNVSSPALTLAHAVHSTLLSNISSSLDEIHANCHPGVKIVRFHGETIVNIYEN